MRSYFLPPQPARKKSRPATHRKTEEESQLDGGEGGERGAESYDRRKAWSSINHSILSAAQYLFVLGV